MFTSLRPTEAICPRCALRQQIRHATFIPRPKRPYVFTQLITLSDGSTFTHRTTSPQAVYRSIKDTKNTALWNPSNQKLMNAEDDYAGRLRKFRERFGRGFDVAALDQTNDAQDPEDVDPSENLMDLISGHKQEEDFGKRKDRTKKDKTKKGE